MAAGRMRHRSARMRTGPFPPQLKLWGLAQVPRGVRSVGAERDPVATPGQRLTELEAVVPAFGRRWLDDQRAHDCGNTDPP